MTYCNVKMEVIQAVSQHLHCSRPSYNYTIIFQLDYSVCDTFIAMVCILNCATQYTMSMCFLIVVFLSLELIVTLFA